MTYIVSKLITNKMNDDQLHSILCDIHYNTNNPAAFSTPKRLIEHLKSSTNKVKRKHVIEWLMKQKTYTLHKDRRVRFKRCKYNICNIDDLWEIDLIDMQHISRKNSGQKYILAVIDCFSKYAWCVNQPIIHTACNPCIDCLYLCSDSR